MKKFSLGQDWVSRVTNSNDSEAPVVGINQSPAPAPDERKSFFEELARSETVREMSRRKWLKPTSVATRESMAERGAAVFEFLCANRSAIPAYAAFKGRRPTTQRTLLDELATQAWLARIAEVAHADCQQRRFDASTVDAQFLSSLAQLSSRAQGPKLALDVVREAGICVVVESALPGMSIDGASFHTNHSNAVLALTVRHDRLDNFWFTLLHEIGHLCLHLAQPSDEVFIDSEEESGSDEVEAEAEANAFAKDSLIPRDIWLRSAAHRFGNEATVIALAKQLKIHPAIVAGRIRYERREFRIFNDLIGRGMVRDVIFGN